MERIYRIKGLKTRKVYAEGTAEECAKHLENMFPYKYNKNKGKVLMDVHIFEEPLIKERIK